jgi:hypothetical protein
MMESLDSPEAVAFALLRLIGKMEGWWPVGPPVATALCPGKDIADVIPNQSMRDRILSLYRQCLFSVVGNRTDSHQLVPIGLRSRSDEDDIPRH